MASGHFTEDKGASFYLLKLTDSGLSIRSFSFPLKHKLEGLYHNYWRTVTTSMFEDETYLGASIAMLLFLSLKIIPLTDVSLVDTDESSSKKDHYLSFNQLDVWLPRVVFLSDASAITAKINFRSHSKWWIKRTELFLREAHSLHE